MASGNHNQHEFYGNSTPTQQEHIANTPFPHSNLSPNLFVDNLF